MNVRVIKYHQSQDSQVHELQWPNGWDIPRVGEVVDLTHLGIIGMVTQVHWTSSTPKEKSHMLFWLVTLELA